MTNFRVDPNHSIDCPKASKYEGLSMLCQRRAHEVAVTRSGEAIHFCPKHGAFKVLYSGDIKWSRKPVDWKRRF